MKNQIIKGQSKLPRINFEVPETIKEAIVNKCRIEGVSQRTVGVLLFKEWLAQPPVPEGHINVN